MITPILEEVYNEIKEKGVGNRRNKKPYTIKIPEYLRKGQFFDGFTEWVELKKGYDMFYITDKQFEVYLKEFIKELGK